MLALPSVIRNGLTIGSARDSKIDLRMGVIVILRYYIKIKMFEILLPHKQLPESIIAHALYIIKYLSFIIYNHTCKKDYLNKPWISIAGI